MDAVVLAGGYATRLWPITKRRPKMFLPVGDSTVVDRIFAGLETDDRIDSVYVSTNERFAGEFENHIAESPFEKPELSIEKTAAESEKLGVIGALDQLIDREGITDDLLVIAGDNLISFDPAEFVDFFYEAETPTVAAYDVGSYDRATSYGVVELDGEKVINFQEKPENPKSTLVSIACYAFPAASLDRIGAYLDGDNNPDEPGWFIQWLYTRETVRAFCFEDAWFDIGTADGYLDVVAWILNGGTRIADDATVQNSEIDTNVQIMNDAEVRDSTIRNSVVFPDATVVGCDLRNSIIDENTHIEGLDLADALIGAHSHLPDGE
jgi:glucose-1-phosphate thymidylyltransferase